MRQCPPNLLNEISLVGIPFNLKKCFDTFGGNAHPTVSDHCYLESEGAGQDAVFLLPFAWVPFAFPTGAGV